MVRILKYIWAGPNTLIGLSFALPGMFHRPGGLNLVDGVLEIHGRWPAFFLRRICGVWLGGGAAAMTLGHVVIGLNSDTLRRSRAHERVHVRQYERWGPLFLPAYLMSSLVLKVRGRDGYLDNPFEREAYAIAD